MLRSKTWISGLGTILKEFRKTNIPEKREVNYFFLIKSQFPSLIRYCQVCRELHELMNDADFEKKLLDTNLVLNTKV
jgi:hypothetical protein